MLDESCLGRLLDTGSILSHLVLHLARIKRKFLLWVRNGRPVLVPRNILVLDSKRVCRGMGLLEEVSRAPLAADTNVFVMDAVMIPPSWHLALPDPRLIASTLYIIQPM
jgi:hypothetical protein